IRTGCSSPSLHRTKTTFRWRAIKDSGQCRIIVSLCEYGAVEDELDFACLETLNNAALVCVLHLSVYDRRRARSKLVQSVAGGMRRLDSRREHREAHARLSVVVERLEHGARAFPGELDDFVIQVSLVEVARFTAPRHLDIAQVYFGTNGNPAQRSEPSVHGGVKDFVAVGNRLKHVPRPTLSVRSAVAVTPSIFAL